MAHVASNTTDVSPRPLLDRLTHSVIKETSKSLKYYIDVKRRENAFVLNSSVPTLDTRSLRASFIYGTSRDQSRLSGSYHAEKDLQHVHPTLQQKQSQLTSISPEKEMCREELNFHMRSYHFSPRENPKFAELRLRSSSSCSAKRDVRSRSPFKLTRREQNQLVDDTADILASLVKSRRSIYETSLLTQQTPFIYTVRNANSSPRPTEESSYAQPSVGDLRLLSDKLQAKQEDIHGKGTSTMKASKLIRKGLICEYKISITTGNCNGASTNAPIRMKLYGTNGHTNFYELVHSETHHIPFLKNQTDIFMLQTYHVGDLVGIIIGHDRKDMKASWFLSKVSIDDPIRRLIYEIPCNAWLSSKANDQKTMRDFQVVSMVSPKQKINVHEGREENESQSDYSTTEGTITSNTTNLSESVLLNDSNQLKKHRKQQQHVSIGPTTVAQKPSSKSTSTDHPPQTRPPLITTIEAHFNRDQLLPPPSQTSQMRSPIQYTTSDTEIEGNITDRTRSTTPTPLPTLNQIRLQSVSEHETLQTKSTSDIFKRHTINYDRPPARLEKRSTPLSMSPDRLNNNRNNEENIAFASFE